MDLKIATLVTILLLCFSLQIAANPSPYQLAYDFEITLFHHFLENTLDLRDENDDQQNYTSLLYHTTFDFRYRNLIQVFLKAQMTGPAFYSAPVFNNDPVKTRYGERDNLSSAEFAPYIEEIWLDALIFPRRLHVKLGRFPYQVPGTYALNSKYANYGVSVWCRWRNLKWEAHYEIPGWNIRYRWGPKPPGPKPPPGHNSNAHYFAADVSYSFWKAELTAYASYLIDKTRPPARVNLLWHEIRRDELGIAGLYAKLRWPWLKLEFEYDRNFGQADAFGEGAKDIEHTGYFIRHQLTAYWGFFEFNLEGIYASGKGHNREEYRPQGKSKGPNHAFSVFPPSNLGMYGTRYPQYLGPYLFLGNAYALHYGIPRPGLFGFPHLLENIAAGNIGVTAYPHDRVTVYLGYWGMKSLKPGYRRYPHNVTKPNQSFLGQELDLFTKVNIWKGFSVKLLAGYFLPGDYYEGFGKSYRDIAALPPHLAREREVRPVYVQEQHRRDDSAYLFEIGLEWHFGGRF